MVVELILGTAEFGHPDYAPHPDKKTIIRILNRAWEYGVRTLDVSDTYNLDFPLFAGFKLLMKNREISSKTFYHYKPGEAPNPTNPKASVYDLEQLTSGLEAAIVPINLNDSRFINHPNLPKTVYARSIFANGQLLKDGFLISDCIKYVLRVPNLSGIIVGVRTPLELEQIVDVIKEFNK